MMNQNNRPEQLRQILKNVIDPEVEVNIVDLGLVYNIECPDELTTNIEMTLSTPACPIGDVIVMNVILECRFMKVHFLIKLENILLLLNNLCEKIRWKEFKV